MQFDFYNKLVLHGQWRLAHPALLWHPWCITSWWWSTKMPLLQWRFESGSSLVWRDDGKLQATTSPLATVHAGVKPIFGFSSLYIHWTCSSQGCSPAQQPWDDQGYHEDESRQIQLEASRTFPKSNTFNSIYLCQCLKFYFHLFFPFHSSTFNFIENFSINIVICNWMISLKLSDEGWINRKLTKTSLSGKKIPDVIFPNYISSTTARSSYSITLYGYSSYGQNLLNSHFSQVFNLDILDLGRWSQSQRPSWEEKEDRLTQPDNLDVTLADDDQPGCLCCSEGVSLEVLCFGEMVGSYRPLPVL